LGASMIAQSFVPSVDSCDIGGQSFLYRLDPLTGGFVGVGSFGTDKSGAQAIPGTIGILSLLYKATPGQSNRTGVVLNIDIKGGLSGFRFDLGGLGTFRTWRQLLD